MKKRIVVPSLGLLVLALTAVLIGTLAPPPEATARPSCDCVGYYCTSVVQGQGSSCSEAHQDLYARAFDLAEDFCGVGDVCNAALVITAGCREEPPGSGQHVIDGYITHGCCAGGM